MGWGCEDGWEDGCEDGRELEALNSKNRQGGDTMMNDLRLYTRYLYYVIMLLCHYVCGLTLFMWSSCARFWWSRNHLDGMLLAYACAKGGFASRESGPSRRHLSSVWTENNLPSELERTRDPLRCHLGEDQARSEPSDGFGLAEALDVTDVRYVRYT
jgi:hypothetical protein